MTNVPGMNCPEVAILLATYNGRLWLPEQVASILGQTGARVRLLVSDDGSTDGTLEWLQDMAGADSRIEVLPTGQRFGSAGANFYRLLMEADFAGADYVGFADQDDIWLPGKLARALAILRAGADAVSSNVTAFWPDGRERLICKSQAQTDYDYLFEAGGPGCTYLFPLGGARELRELLIDQSSGARTITHHDWFCYAACRALGRRWVIDSLPLMRYRQHASNEVGANTGWRAAAGRRRKVASGWYRHEVDKVCQLALRLRPGDTRLASIHMRVVRGNLADRLVMVAGTGRFRRSLRDRIALAGLFGTGIFWGKAGPSFESR